MPYTPGSPDDNGVADQVLWDVRLFNSCATYSEEPTHTDSAHHSQIRVPFVQLFEHPFRIILDQIRRKCRELDEIELDG